MARTLDLEYQARISRMVVLDYECEIIRVKNELTNGNITQADHDDKIRRMTDRIEEIRNRPDPVGVCEECGVSCRPGDDHIYDRDGECYVCWDCHDLQQDRLREEFGYLKAV